jgi:hypothetical protein
MEPSTIGGFPRGREGATMAVETGHQGWVLTV